MSVINLAANSIPKEARHIVLLIQAIDLIRIWFRDHYEVLAWKMELETMFRTGKKYIAPVFCPWFLSVMFHCCLTKDEVISPPVNMSEQLGMDINPWLVHKLLAITSHANYFPHLIIRCLCEHKKLLNSKQATP